MWEFNSTQRSRGSVHVQFATFRALLHLVGSFAERITYLKDVRTWLDTQVSRLCSCLLHYVWGSFDIWLALLQEKWHTEKTWERDSTRRSRGSADALSASMRLLGSSPCICVCYCMYTYICVCCSVYMYVYIIVCIHIYIYVVVYIFMCTFVYREVSKFCWCVVSLHAAIWFAALCLYLWMYVYICMYICIYMYKNIYIYIYIYI